MNSIIIYVIIINVISFILMGWDKYCAIKNNWRISEKNLIGIALLGGGPGSLLGMITFRHKTKKKKFQILIPLSIIINIYLLLKVI